LAPKSLDIDPWKSYFFSSAESTSRMFAQTIWGVKNMGNKKILEDFFCNGEKQAKLFVNPLLGTVSKNNPFLSFSEQKISGLRLMEGKWSFEEEVGKAKNRKREKKEAGVDLAFYTGWRKHSLLV